MEGMGRDFVGRGGACGQITIYRSLAIVSVIPACTGIQSGNPLQRRWNPATIDSGLRRNDGLAGWVGR